jgi:hypothetical protein
MNIVTKLKRSMALLCFTCLYSELAFGEPVGLFCPEPNSVPRIIQIDVATTTRFGTKVYSLASGEWYSPAIMSSVSIDEIKIYPLASIKYTAYLTINRSSLVLLTNLNADNEITQTQRRYSCTVHTPQEISELASRETARINQVRQF